MLLEPAHEYDTHQASQERQLIRLPLAGDKEFKLSLYGENRTDERLKQS